MDFCISDIPTGRQFIISDIRAGGNRDFIQISSGEFCTGVFAGNNRWEVFKEKLGCIFWGIDNPNQHIDFSSVFVICIRRIFNRFQKN